MLKAYWKWYIENIDVKSLKIKDILKMQEIERDTWSDFMGEYVKCNNCNITFSKNDIYSEEDIKTWRTVSDLEKDYWRNNLKCSCCWWDTIDVRGDNLISVIESRLFDTKDSFVSMYKSKVWEILGFSYGFIDSPEATYNREFSYHFNDNLLDIFLKKFWTRNILTLSWVCAVSKEININLIYELIMNFYCSMESKYDDMFSVWEAIKWTPSYKIYSKVLPDTIDLSDKKFLADWVTESSSELVFWEKTVKRYKKFEWMWLKEFIFSTRNITKDILVNY